MSKRSSIVDEPNKVMVPVEEALVEPALPGRTLLPPGRVHATGVTAAASVKGFGTRLAADVSSARHAIHHATCSRASGSS
jgi:hypothetical protein